ncbi:MAG: hypothetical protein QXF26_09885 [Candidatus Bathyarchaeia archaeon]
MAVITIRVDEKTKEMMSRIEVNWSEVIRDAIKRRIKEERTKNLAKAILINERLMKRSRGELKAEEIIRRFRDERYGKSSR